MGYFMKNIMQEVQLKNYNNKWKNGDTFALKIDIKDCKYEEYGIKYLIINNIGINNEGNNLVRIKTSESIDLKNPLKDLNKLEYIKTSFFWYEDGPYYINKNKINNLKFYANEYNMIFLNIIELAHFSKEKTKEFQKSLIYLGNYNLTPPENEFFPEYLDHIDREFLILDRFQENMINSYEWFNKKKSEAFNTDFARKQNEIAKGTHILINEYCDSFHNKPKLSKDEKIKDISKIEDTLTYVGGDSDYLQKFIQNSKTLN